MKLIKHCLIGIVTLLTQFSIAQEGLPIYSDYLTDNYYLIHPSMAGVGNSNKIRLTTRKQWFGQDDAPRLSTLSVNGRIGESSSGVGVIIYSDKNGFHSQNGVYLTYAHHLMFSRNPIDLNMLSFGLSVGVIQYKLDETSFLSQGFDPIISGIELSATNFNIDFGFSYHYTNFYAHFTIKNVLENDGINFNEQGLSFTNLRTYLISAGNVFHKNKSEWSFEPSLMFMFRDATQESFIDVNFKAYKKMDYGKIWGGLSYRRSLDGAEFLDGSGVSSQKLQYFTPFMGIDYNQFVFAYTYSYQANSVVFSNGGFHQLTVGYNFGVKREKWDCECPGINY